MTMAEIYDWAIAWAKREIVRRKIARGETPIQAGDKPLPKATRAAEDASISRDEHDPRIAWCVGKRNYLGDDTQISRLFWLLASPVGRARTLGEVQRAIDSFETDREDKDNDKFEDAMKRLRKAISKLRRALHENKADDHLLTVRGGSAASPEYTMVLRFHEKPRRESQQYSPNPRCYRKPRLLNALLTWPVNTASKHWPRVRMHGPLAVARP